jgi:radical SAM protein with 4Fe4S-binding SPASM domain
VKRNSSVPELSAAAWVSRLQKKAGIGNLPLRASVEFTERCNLGCVHCYVNQPAGDRALRRRELTLEQWKDILDQAAEAGVIWLMVTGGEPLLRPDFTDFYLYAKHKGFHVTLMTNGTLLTPDLTDLFVEFPPWEIEVTLYGATAETYECITGVRGSYDRCIRGIDLLLERGLALNLKTMALTLNVHEIRAMQQMAKKWDVRFRYDPAVHSRLDGSRKPLACRLSPEEIVALEKNDPKRMTQWHDYCSHPAPRVDPGKLFTCGAALNSFHIDPYGGLHPCLTVRWLEYDLLTGSLGEALHEFLPQVRSMPVQHDHTCWQCDLRPICQPCAAWSQCEMGEPETPDPFRCRLAHLRNQVLGLSIPVITETEAKELLVAKEDPK